MKRITQCIISCLITVQAEAQLVITSVFDGPLSGGVPKGIELYATEEIDNLSVYGLGSANNGGGSDGIEFTFPTVSIPAGTYLYVSSEQSGFEQFFGFAPNYTSNAMSINGDDAIELFKDGQIIETFGEIDIDGTGSAWEYMDGWASRKPGTTATVAFQLADWSFSGRNALDGASSNASAANPIPLRYFANGSDPTDPTDPSEPEITLISNIQGTPDTHITNEFGETDVSPLIGTNVTIEGIVVGDFQANDDDASRDLNGFFVQEESSDEDGNPLSSEGIFVFDSGFGQDVALGDLVRVTGTVDQYFGETQLSSISAIEVISSDKLAMVNTAAIALSSITEVTLTQSQKYQPNLEAFEGMLVEFTDELTINEQFQLDRFNEIKLVAGERPYQFSQLQVPDITLFKEHKKKLGVRTITYDDGLNLQSQGVELLDGFVPYTELSSKRMGDSIQGLSGVLDYKWAGNRSSGATWRVRAHKDGTNTFTSTLAGNSANPRPLSAPSVSGNLKVASYNVLNFFSTIDITGARTAIGGDPRGADTHEEFDRQINKLIHAISAIDADVIGLVEIENEFDPVNDDSTAIEVLVNALNDSAGEIIYDYVYPGETFAGGDVIAVAMLYKVASIQLTNNTKPVILTDPEAANLGIFSSRDFSADPIFNGNATNRSPLAVSFTHIETGEVFTVVVNHFKSKGPSNLDDTSSPNFDKNDGAGFWNARRLDASMAIDAWLETHPTGSSDSDIIILGDLNAYAKEEPVQYLLDRGYNNVESDSDYSFVFDGQLGTLDYILISDSLLEKFSESQVWHINADEADAIDYNLDFNRDPSYFDTTTATRNSDHDPLIVGFTIAAPFSPIERLIAEFAMAVDSQEITGVGRFPFIRKFNLRRMSFLLRKAQVFEERGRDRITCKLLNMIHMRSDEDGLPRDIITGPGTKSFNERVLQAMTLRSCMQD